MTVIVDTSRRTFADSAAGSPGAGSWKVGACVRDVAAQALDNNDWTRGWATVVNGTPTADATSSGTKAGTGSH